MKRDVCVAEGDCLLFRAMRADCTAGYYTSPPAQAGNGSFTAGGACGVPREFTILPLAGGKVSALRRSSSIRAGAGERGSPGMQKLLVFRPARVLSNRFFVKQSPRVYPRNCYITHFQYPSAFLQHFRIPLYFVFPAPTFPPVGAGRGYSRRETESPSGRTFSGDFSLRREKSPLRSKNEKLSPIKRLVTPSYRIFPRAGSAKQTIIAYRKIRSKTSKLPQGKLPSSQRRRIEIHRQRVFSGGRIPRSRFSPRREPRLLPHRGGRFP